MEIKGKVVHVGDTETFPSGFQKRFIVVEAKDGDYTKNYGAEVFKDNVSKFDRFSVGDEVSIEVFDNSVAKVREYNGKWYSDMPTCMKIEKVGAAPPATAPAPGEDDSDSIPF